MQDSTDDTSRNTTAPATHRPAEQQPTTDACCGFGSAAETGAPQLGQRARAARAIVGAGQLVAAGALTTRRAPGRIALWPLAMVFAWFGVSHLVAAQIGYRGCPEIGAIPTVLRGRPVTTWCWSWQQVDRWLGCG